MRKSFVILFYFIYCSIYGQDISFTGKSIKLSDNESFKNVNKEMLKAANEFKVFEINVSDIYNFINKKNNTNRIKFQLELGDKHKWQLELTEHNLFSENFRRVKQANKGKEISFTPPELKTFRGHNMRKHQKVTLTIGPNWIYGKVSNEKGGYYFIEPLRLYNLNAKSNQFVVYSTDESAESDYLCKQNGISTIDSENILNKSSLAIDCLEIAIAYDQATKIGFGGASATENILTSRFNEVSTFFFNNFDINKTIIEFYESGINEITLDNNLIACNDPRFINVCSTNSILNNFRQWGEKEKDPNSGFSTNPDAATFFTNRNGTDFAGYSYIGGICRPIGYNWVNENISMLEYRKVNLWIHEYGHTWSATHVDDSRNMMNRIISFNDPMEVSNETFNRITFYKSISSCVRDIACSTLSTDSYNAKLYDIEIFPNPTTSILNINTNKQLKKIEVYNYLGQKILETNQIQINTSNFKNGIYLLKVFSINREIGIKKFIKV